MDNDILIINDFLSKKEIKYLTNECKKRHKEFKQKDNYIKTKILNSNEHKLMKNIKSRIELLFDKSFHTQIMRHINMTDKETVWEDHFDSNKDQRIKYGVVLYINDNFLGGQIFYKNLGLTHQPKSGQLVIHPSSLEYTHTVLPVTDGERYTLTTFIRDEK